MMYMCYDPGMEVTITQFRKDLFTLVKQAEKGIEVWVKHKGGRFKIEPEKKLGSKLDRVTATDCINFDVPDPGDGSLLREMTTLWEKDWEQLERLP